MRVGAKNRNDALLSIRLVAKRIESATAYPIPLHDVQVFLTWATYVLDNTGPLNLKLVICMPWIPIFKNM